MVKVVRLKEIKPPKPPEVIYKDRVVYRVPGKELEPVNVEAVCKGSRTVKILKMDISKKDDKNTTWLILQPIGSDVKITCYLDGDMSNFWYEGDIMTLSNAKPS